MTYTKKALTDRCIPFEDAAPMDPFYSDANLRQIRRADRQLKNGHAVEKSIEELEELTSKR